MKLPIWLVALVAGLAAVFGIKTHYEKRLEDERERVIDENLAAAKRLDEESLRATNSKLRSIDSELERQREKPTSTRFRDAVRRARARKRFAGNLDDGIDRGQRNIGGYAREGEDSPPKDY